MVAERPKERPKPPPIVHLLAGGLGGMCGAVVTAPFDVLKTRLQSDMFRAAEGAKATSGWGHFKQTGVLLRNIYSHEGPSALFRGLVPTLFGVIPARSINFFTYGNGKPIISRLLGREEDTVVHLLAAANAGVVTAAATNPIWVVKTRMQLEASSNLAKAKAAATSASGASKPAPALPQFSPSFSARTLTTAAAAHKPSASEVTLRILRTEGIKGLYRGLSASLLGVTEGTIQWALYEQGKKMVAADTATSIARHGKGSSGGDGWKISLAAAGAKLSATLITYPHEVIRTRLRQPEPSKYKGLYQSFALVWKEEGAAALYGGMTAHLLRVVPNAVTMFLVYETAVKAFTPASVQRLDQEGAEVNQE